MTRETLSNGLNFSAFIDKKFKSNLLTINFILPLKQETASKYAMIPRLLTMSSCEYDDIIKLNKKLGKLFGASIVASVKKIGCYQVISLGINFLSSRYLLDNKDIKKECCNLLISILKSPNIVDGSFLKRDIDIAKNTLIDKIDYRKNDKAIFALDRCKQLMFEGSDLAVCKFGTKEQITNLRDSELTEAYEEILNKSKIEISYVGSEDVSEIKSICENGLKNLRNSGNFDISFLPTKIKSKYLEIEEVLDLSQAKLVLGMKCETDKITPEKSRAYNMMNIIYGGAPFSKLFMNVREKMSLCYSCVSRYDKFSGSFVVYMGLEYGDKNKAFEESIKQLESIQKGEFSDEDIKNSKDILKNRYLQLKDSLGDLSDWYLNQTMFGLKNNIEEELKFIDNITKEEIIEAATSVKLDTVYCLKGDESKG